MDDGVTWDNGYRISGGPKWTPGELFTLPYEFYVRSRPEGSIRYIKFRGLWRDVLLRQFIEVRPLDSGQQGPATRSVNLGRDITHVYMFRQINVSPDHSIIYMLVRLCLPPVQGATEERDNVYRAEVILDANALRNFGRHRVRMARDWSQVVEFEGDDNVGDAYWGKEEYLSVEAELWLDQGIVWPLWGGGGGDCT